MMPDYRHSSIYKPPHQSKDFDEAIERAKQVGNHVAEHGRPPEVVSVESAEARERRRLRSPRWRFYNRPGNKASKALSDAIGQDK